jgi:squalene synthase HpnC
MESIKGVRHTEPVASLDERTGAASDLAGSARAENFPVASHLLPTRYRRHLLATYAFARTVDDIGDEDSTIPVEERRRRLNELECDLRRLYAGAMPRDAVIRALRVTVEECHVPIDPFQKLIQANLRDQEVTRYGSYAELRDYCRLSADPVGHIVLYIFGKATPERIAMSDRVCTALQVIEHCQDVGEDVGRGRVYMPADDMERLGCSVDDLRAARTPMAVRALVSLEASRARQALDQGAPLIGTLSGFARAAVAGFVSGGRATLDALDRAGYDVLAQQVHPSKARLLTRWPVAFITGR